MSAHVKMYIKFIGLLSAVFLTACGGGSSAPTITPPPPPPPPPTLVWDQSNWDEANWQ